MGVTYFKRFRMELDLRDGLFPQPMVPSEYFTLLWDENLIEQHSETKFRSFRFEIDANVLSMPRKS